MEKEQVKDMPLIEYLSAHHNEPITKGEMIGIIDGITRAYDERLDEAYKMILGQSLSLEVLTNIIIEKGLATKEELKARGNKLVKKDIALMKQGAMTGKRGKLGKKGARK